MLTSTHLPTSPHQRKGTFQKGTSKPVDKLAKARAHLVSTLAVVERQELSGMDTAAVKGLVVYGAWVGFGTYVCLRYAAGSDTCCWLDARLRVIQYHASRVHSLPNLFFYGATKTGIGKTNAKSLKS
jgi:hypothetical protein